MTDPQIASYLAEQRAARDRPTVIAFPILYPREILTALNLCAWEVWRHDAQDSTCDHAGRVQAYLCPTVRGAHALLAENRHAASAIVVPHTCDSMQGLATVAKDMRASHGVPVLSFRHPRSSHPRLSRDFLRNEVRAFIATLEGIFGRRLDPAELSRSIELHREIEANTRTILRTRRNVTLPDRALYTTLRKGEWLHPEDFVQELRELSSRMGPSPSASSRVPVLVSGMVPEPMSFLEVVDEAGAIIVADDYAALGRRIPLSDLSCASNPIDTVVERLLLRPICPTRSSNAEARIDHLRTLADASGARGVILHTVKFCEPELFDVPLVRQGLEAVGLKVLHIETEFETSVSAQTATRVEAFVEVLSQRGAGA